ncbi:MAG: DEAD/DEAH box helicase family protein [candidate division WOR-3 bacterium]
MNIEKYLILNKYLLSLFGADDIKSLFNELKTKNEGIDSEGRSNFINALRSIENLKISEDKLLTYDKNIQFYVRKINYRREPVNLKYFQYLAVLFSEIILDNLKNAKISFLYELNKFLEKYKEKNDTLILESFTENDLKKLAFWMATGSGKTLIAHINYYQFLNYELFSPDNIIFITPNEGLSKQHFEELLKSDIPAKLYTGSLNGELKSENEVLVIEMTKFVEEKKGGGVTLPVDVFEGKNLIFVDEGHKGRRSEEQKWARLRNKLAENGFVFEYSATFGQILSESQPETLKEYAKSIVFDYSYKYFYLDGYGKDFSVINVRQIGLPQQEFQEGMFVANLLSFYEQLMVYEENKNLAREYNIEKPLWIFVGTTVTGKEEESDVIQIVQFIKKIIEDEDWVKRWTDKIFKGETGLKNEQDEDIFSDKFKYLKERKIYFDDLYKRVFGGKGSLKLFELKNAEGEIGLKVGENDYFGVINIGNVPGFKKQMEKNGISLEQDAISFSLFDNIKKENSRINLLIGSKKFIEGWDTWRVSSMGLLNIGKGQGPQIIQLFGRGVRLKGKGMSLKRSGGDFRVQVLETLNIYGFKADYLKSFLEAISREEVEFETIEIPVEPQHRDKWRDLYILSKPDKRFEEENVLRLRIDDEIHCRIDLQPRISMYQAGEKRAEGVKMQETRTNDIYIRFPENLLELLDWQRIFQEIIEFKKQRNYWNLIFDAETLKNILLSEQCVVQSLPDVFQCKNKEDIKRLDEIALLVLKKYIQLFFTKNAKRFETENLTYVNAEQLGLPLIFQERQSYIIQVDKRKRDLIQNIRILIKDLEKLIKEEDKCLPRIYFHGFLYLPILLEDKKIDKISPPGLVESEKIFISGIRDYLKNNKSKFSDLEIYVLRNIPKSGVGFQLQWSGFYPDFIMWIKKDKLQVVTFIDPKGLVHSKGLDDEKIQFAIEIKELEKKLGYKNVFLESFILSITPYDYLAMGMEHIPSKTDFINNHVLFLKDQDWQENLFKSICRVFTDDKNAVKKGNNKKNGNNVYK